MRERPLAPLAPGAWRKDIVEKTPQTTGGKRVLKIDCDVRILVIVLVLIGIGASLVASSSSFFAGGVYSDHFALLRKHIFKVVVALVGMMLAIHVDYRGYRKWSPALLGGAIILLAGLFFMHQSIRSTERWYYSDRLNMALQPGEVARMALVFFLAYWITRSGPAITDLKRGFLPAAAAICIVVGLIAATPNYGSAAMTLLVALTVLFLGGARLGHLGGFAAASFAAAAVKIGMTDYARNRVLAFFHPDAGVMQQNWQVFQSLVGLGSGGLVGRGVGGSTQKLSWLPDSYTDFIFSILGEELGLLGTLAVSGMFLLLVLRALKISRRCGDRFGEMLVVGIGCSIFCYAAVNMYVATGLFPVTGLPLPFLSYGGSALVVNAVAVGVLLNVSRNRAERDRTGHRGNSEYERAYSP